MNQSAVEMDQAHTASQSSVVKFLLTLLILTPLIYSNDGDNYRAYKVVIVGMLFLLIATPKLHRLALWVRSGTAYVLAIALLIAIQPAFVDGAEILYNLNFLVALLSCFLPTLYLSNCQPARARAGIAFVHKPLGFLFGISVISLLVSAFTGVGEVYTQDGELQIRAFAWLGDSFSPVMVFFLYYYAFGRKAIGVLLAAGCIVTVMQAKMAILMAVLGYLVYLLLFGRWKTRLFLTAVIALSVLVLPAMFEMVVGIIPNFEHSLNNRLLSFDAGWTYFWSSPWFGVGANQTFTLLSKNFDVTTLFRFDKDLPYYEFFQIQNSFLRILAELGLIGFLLFIAFCAVIVRRSYAVLVSAHALPPGNSRTLSMACALWLISFVLFYQTTGWFEPGHPQLMWLICFLTLMNFYIRAQSGHKTTENKPGAMLPAATQRV
jgi:O-antigen ligase